jgi:MFS family permease
MRIDSGPLRERPFRLLWLGRTASTFGDSLAPVALAFAVLEIGGGASGIGFVLASFSAAQIAFLLVGGVWSDRLPRRLVMLTCDALRAAVDAFIAIALLTGSMRVWMFVVTAAIFGAASAFFQPASSGLVPQTVSAAQLQQANGLLSISQTSTRLFGPALSGAIVAFANAGWVFAIDAVTFVVSACFLAVLHVEATAAPRQRFLADLGEGWRAVRSRSWLTAGLACVAFLNMGIAPFLVLGPVVASESLGGAKAWGVIASCGAVGGVLGGMTAMRVRPGRPLVWCFTLWMLGALPLLTLVPPLPALAVGAALACFVFTSNLGNTLWETVMQRQIPAGLRSRVYSFDMLVSVCFVPLGQVASGPLSAAIGIRPTLVGGALILVVPCLVALAVPSVRNLEDDSAAVVHEHAVAEVPVDGAG